MPLAKIQANSLIMIAFCPRAQRGRSAYYELPTAHE